MQINKNFDFPTTDTFSEAFESFQASGLFDRLQKKYQLKPYFEKYKAHRQVVFASSFFLNLFFIGTAFTCVFVVLKVVLPADLLAVVFSLVFLVLLEALKRLTIPGLFKTFLQFRKLNVIQAVVIIVLTAASVFLSYNGAKDVIHLLTPSVHLTDIGAKP